MTAPDLLAKINQQQEEAAALKAQWDMYLGNPDWMPSKRQFLIWLDISKSIDIVSAAIEATAKWLNKCDSDDVEKTPQDAILYTSKVIVLMRDRKLGEQSRERERNRKRGGKPFEE